MSIAGSLRGLQKGAGLVKRQLTKALEEQQGAAGSSSGKVLDKQAGAGAWVRGAKTGAGVVAGAGVDTGWRPGGGLLM